MSKIRLFTPGPLNHSEEILSLGSKDLPYYRDPDFAEMTLDNEKMLLKVVGCKLGNVIPYTCSGTGAMDAVMLNLIAKTDRVLIINGGSFGQRWVDMCKFYEYRYKELKVGFGKDLNIEEFENELKDGFNVVLMQAEETDSGQLFNLKQIGEILKKHKGYLIVDAISSFLADNYYMDSHNIDATLISSQKGLKLPAGAAFLIVNRRIQKKLMVRRGPRSFYFDFSYYLDKHALKRGYVPFTPAVTIMYQLNKRLKKILQHPLRDVRETKGKALYFRDLIKDLPLRLVAETPSNFLSGLVITDKNKTADDLYNFLKTKNMYITKPGKTISLQDPSESKRFIRITHSGLEKEDYLLLYYALKEFFKK